MSADIAVFLAARYDEAEALARGAGGRTAGDYRWREVDPEREPGLIGTGTGDVVVFGLGMAACAASPSRGQAAHIAACDPAHRLADIALKRAILAAYVEVSYMDIVDPEPEYAYGRAGALGEAVHHLAAEFAGHPDYRQEWAVEH